MLLRPALVLEYFPPSTTLNTTLALIVVTGAALVAWGSRQRNRTAIQAGCWAAGLAGLVVAVHVLFFVGFGMVVAGTVPFPLNVLAWPVAPFTALGVGLVIIAKFAVFLSDKHAPEVAQEPHAATLD